VARHRSTIAARAFRWDVSDFQVLSLFCRKRRLSHRSMRNGLRWQEMRPGGLDHSAYGSSFLESVFFSHVAFG
jgi:hypothetical protein